MVKKGTLMDATIVEAQAKRPSLREGRGGSKTDPDARFTRKRGKTHFGYKAHIGVDAGSGLIRKALLTPANVNDTEVADELVSGDEEAVYADKAYGSKQRSEWLKSMKIKDRIMRRANKHHPGAPALGAGAERADIAVARAGGASVRDAEAVVRLRPGAVHGAREERDGVAVQVHGVQPAEGGPARARRRLSAWGGVRLAAEGARKALRTRANGGGTTRHRSPSDPSTACRTPHSNRTAAQETLRKGLRRERGPEAGGVWAARFPPARE